VGTADLAITNVAPLQSIVGQGYLTRIYVTIVNQDESTVAFNVSAYANTTLIQMQTLMLLGGNSTITSFTWNTTGFVKGNYTIWAHAEPLQGETDTADNTLTDGPVKVTIPGDVAEPFGFVDMTDIGWICLAYASTPTHPQWNPNMDINNDNIVDMTDIGIACLNYAKPDP